MTDLIVKSHEVYVMTSRSRRSSFASWNRAGLGLLALLLAAAGCVPSPPTPATPTASTPGKEVSKAGTRRLILLTNGDSPFWDACRAGMKDAERDLKLAEAGFQAVLDV